MRTYQIAILLELLAVAKAQTPVIISESPLMTAGIIAPPAAPGGANPPPPPGAAMPAPMMPPLATGSPKGGDPIIDLKPLMTAPIIGGSMKLNEAAGIPQPAYAPAVSINSASLAQAGIVGGGSSPQATSPPPPAAAAPSLPPGINPATLSTAGIIAQPSGAASSNTTAAQGNNTTTSPTGAVPGSQPAGNLTVPAKSSGIVIAGSLNVGAWVGCIMAAVCILA